MFAELTQFTVTVRPSGQTGQFWVRKNSPYFDPTREEDEVEPGIRRWGDFCEEADREFHDLLRIDENVYCNEYVFTFEINSDANTKIPENQQALMQLIEEYRDKAVAFIRLHFEEV